MHFEFILWAFQELPLFEGVEWRYIGYGVVILNEDGCECRCKVVFSHFADEHHSFAIFLGLFGLLISMKSGIFTFCTCFELP